MAITKDNFVVVYIYGNLDSEAFANYYINTHDMSIINTDPSGSSGAIGDIYWQVDGQKVGIQAATISEILSETDFLTNIESPLLEALNSPELISRNIWGIILGYKVPGGYYYTATDPSETNEVVISATSRLSRIKHNFSLKNSNKLFGRQVFKRFDQDDADLSLIVSRIDGPNLQFAKDIVDRGVELNQQVFANGTFYIDPYSDRATTGAEDYTDLLLDFKDNLLPTLNLSQWGTTFMDPYIDPAIPFVENDSFVWSWFTDRARESFFQLSNARRIFFYNADYDGAFEVRSDIGKRWAYLSLNAGYVATAGAMSDPTIAGFLDPNSFFYSLLRGASIGEAFYFSVPHLDWTISLFGDPLTYCSFPGVEIVEEEVIDEHVVWEIMSKDLARVAANLYKKEIELREVVDEIVDLISVEDGVSIEDILLLAPPFDEELATDAAEPAPVSILYPANDLLVSNKEQVWKGNIKSLVNKLFDFPSFRYTSGENSVLSPSINDYLEEHSFKVSRILANITSESKPIGEDNLFDEGWWEFEFTLVDDNPTAFTNYHFILEIFDDEDFSNLILSKDSFAIRNWTYEKEKETFFPLTSNGVSSSYIDRRVRYESRFDSLIGVNEYLNRGQTYYFRITQYNLETGVNYSPREYTDIIYT